MRTPPAITIGEYARRTFWLVTARAAGDSRRRRSTAGRPDVTAAAAAVAAFSIERALIGSTVSWSVVQIRSCTGIWHARAGAKFPASRLSGQIGRNSYQGEERLTIRKRVAIACQHPFDHRLLRKMQKDPLAKGFGAHQRSGGILEGDLDRVRYRGCEIGGKQRFRLGSENFGDAADIRGHHRDSRRGGLYHDIGHRIAAGRNHQQVALRKTVSRLDVANEANCLGEVEPLDLSLESVAFLAVTGQRQRDRPA